MTKRKKETISRTGSSHKAKCARLSKDLKAKYLESGTLWDGGLAESLIKMCGKSFAEDTIYDCLIIAEFIQRKCKLNKRFALEIDKELSKNDPFCRSVKVSSRVPGLKNFFAGIFNYYTPGYIEMHRLLSNPEMFTDEDLDYIRETFINMQFVD